MALSSLGAVAREQLRLTFGKVGKLLFKCFGNVSVERAAGLAQQRAIGRVLDKCVLKDISRVRWRAPPKQQTCSNETV
jgi:hypothetical protein